MLYVQRYNKRKNMYKHILYIIIYKQFFSRFSLAILHIHIYYIQAFFDFKKLS